MGRRSSDLNKPTDKKSVVVKAQWADSAEGHEDAPPVRCDFCGTKIPTGALKCPDCGTAVKLPEPEDDKPNWVRRIGLGLVFILTLVAAWRWGELYLANRPKQGKNGQPAPEGVALLEHSIQQAPGTALKYVRGSVTNHSDAAYYDLKVECELLDKSGASLGKFSDNKMVVDAHKVVPFSISLLDPDAVRYTNITATAHR